MGGGAAESDGFPCAEKPWLFMRVVSCLLFQDSIRLPGRLAPPVAFGPCGPLRRASSEGLAAAPGSFHPRFQATPINWSLLAPGTGNFLCPGTLFKVTRKACAFRCAGKPFGFPASSLRSFLIGWADFLQRSRLAARKAPTTVPSPPPKTMRAGLVLNVADRAVFPCARMRWRVHF